jgi:DNA polymerase-3 subunit chi
MNDQGERIAEFIELRSPEQRLSFVCDLAARHCERGETVAVYCPDPSDAEALDSLLWTFRQNSFIPHVRLEHAEEPLIEPVLIFGGEPDGVEAEVLILASAEGVPEWYERFAYIHDFAAVYDEGMRQAGRDRYAAYKGAGYRMRFVRP